MKRVTKAVSMVLFGLLIACYIMPAVADSGKVNINTASKEVLMTLKGVGEAIAERIIEYRKAHPFKTPEEIMKVKGIGTKIFEANKDKIVV